MWVGAEGAAGWWVVLSLDRPSVVSDVILTLNDASLQEADFLASLDANAWFDLREALIQDPVPIRYLWVVFRDDEAGLVPRVTEMELVQPPH